MSTRKTVEEFIYNAIAIHGNKYDYSLVEYLNSQTKIKIICPVHGSFEQKPNSHLSGKNGCPQCGNKQKTNEHVDKEIANRNITRLSDYKNNSTHIDWLCKVCKYTWSATPSSVINLKSGCPNCAGSIRISNDSVDKKLINRNIVRVTDVVNSITPISWQCKICNYIWETSPSNLFSRQTGCPQCSQKAPITVNIINQKLKNRTILLVSNKIKTIKHHTQWSCCICNYQWEATIDNVINKNRGCPKCAGNAKLTNQDIDQLLLHRNIIRCEDYINIMKHIKWKCMICEHTWKTTPNNVIHHNTGCPKCTPKYSTPQIEWLNFIAKNENVYIQHAENGGEYKIPGTRFKADGYCAKTNTIYEFHGDYWHGNPTTYDQRIVHPINKKTMGELYDNTNKRDQLIRDLGYNVITIWESDWNKIKKEK